LSKKISPAPLPKEPPRKCNRIYNEYQGIQLEIAQHDCLDS